MVKLVLRDFMGQIVHLHANAMENRQYCVTQCLEDASVM